MEQQKIHIIGGGPVGGTLACLLAEQDLALTVIDQVPLEAFLEDESSDGRAIAISPNSRAILERSGIWPFLEAHAEPIMSVKTVHGGSEVVFGDGEPQGYIIPMSLLRQGVAKRLKALQETGRIQWLQGSLKSFNVFSSGIEGTLDSGREFHAHLLVGADGKNSKVRHNGGFEVTSYPYGKNAIVCSFKHDNHHEGIAWEVFLEEGPLAVLPLKGKKSSMVWTVSKGLASDLADLGEEAFNEFLRETLSPYLMNAVCCSRKWIYPISLQFANNFTSEGVCLIGDAAHVVHPLAGQGVNLGLKDAEALLERVTHTLSLGGSVGDYTSLKAMEKVRQFDTLSMASATHMIDRLFSTTQPFLKFLRKKGMRIAGESPLIKGFLSAEGKGLNFFQEVYNE